jgi:hypothetical protein
MNTISPCCACIIKLISFHFAQARAQAKVQADEDGATLEFDDHDNDDDYEVDVAALEEVSDSDEEQEIKNKDHNIPSEETTTKATKEIQIEREKPVSANEDSAGNDMDAFSLERKIPLTHQVDLRGHTKAVACLSCEPAGNRIVTGSMDYSVKMYDFGGMDMRHRAFKALEVQDGYPLAALAHTPSGDKFIACTGSCQPKVYTRDAEEVITFVRGDMYLRDLSHTKVGCRVCSAAIADGLVCVCRVVWCDVVWCRQPGLNNPGRVYHRCRSSNLIQSNLV